MTAGPQPVPELVRPTPERFWREVFPASRPAVLRGAAGDWELVHAGRSSRAALRDYLGRFDAGAAVDVITAPPQVGGRFFYADDARAMNFARGRMPLRAAFDRLAAQGPEGGALYLEATPVDAILAGLERHLPFALAPAGVGPRIWVGGATTVQTHFDLSHNIACVASGRRRVTLFPPEQTPNLYMGPVEHTPSGAPVSLVQLHDVDDARFPKFREAWRNALTADLEPGDAIFIPYLWWHHVESFGDFNILINYWWNEHDALGSPMHAILHAILTLRDLPPPMRAGWKTMFDHFVFGVNGPAAEHIPKAIRGGLGEMSPERRAQLWAALAAGVGQFASHAGRDGPNNNGR